MCIWSFWGRQMQVSQPEQISPERILVIKLSALGDFLLALPAMAAIRRAHPNAHITLLTTKLFVDMATRSGYFDAVMIDKRPKFYEIDAWVDLAFRLNKGRFSRVYDLQMNDRMKRYRRLFVKRPEWSGVLPGSSLSYTNPDWRRLHAFERHREVLRVAGIEMEDADLSWMESQTDIFGLQKPYVLLVPGSSPLHPGKRWPAVKYGALALKLVRDGITVGVIGTAAEQDVIQKIKIACPDIVDLSGRTSFYDIATLARDALAAVGNDTGPTHLIALAGAPIVALFSAASDPALSAPVGRKVTVIQADDMAAITVDDVYKVLPKKKSAIADIA